MTQIVWKGSIMDFTGYSKAAREYILALHHLGADVKIEPDLNNLLTVELPEEEEKILWSLMNKPAFNHPKIYISHDLPDYWEKNGDTSIGFTYWETSKIPAKWLQKVHEMNAVFLPSKHNLEVFQSSNVQVPLFYIRPCLSRPSVHSLKQIPHYLEKLPPFRFLAVFSWIGRKGYDVLLKAFWEEFSAKDDVVLIIKTVGSSRILNEIDEMQRRFQPSHSTAQVYVDNGIRSEAEMDILYRNCQAFVLPTRGEGVGYPLLDAAIRGLPIITTGWGGHMDFLNEHNSYLLPYNLVPVTPQSYYYGYQPDQVWAEPSAGELKKQMRFVFENYGLAEAKGLMAQREIEENLTREKAAEDIISSIYKLTGSKVI